MLIHLSLLGNSTPLELHSGVSVCIIPLISPVYKHWRYVSFALSMRYFRHWCEYATDERWEQDDDRGEGDPPLIIQLMKPLIEHWLRHYSTRCWNAIETAARCTGPVFCLLLRVSSDYAQPITGQVTEVTCPVIGRAQPELTPSKRQKTGTGCGLFNSALFVHYSTLHGLYIIQPCMACILFNPVGLAHSSKVYLHYSTWLSEHYSTFAHSPIKRIFVHYSTL